MTYALATGIWRRRAAYRGTQDGTQYRKRHPGGTGSRRMGALPTPMGVGLLCGIPSLPGRRCVARGRTPICLAHAAQGQGGRGAIPGATRRRATEFEVGTGADLTPWQEGAVVNRTDMILQLGDVSTEPSITSRRPAPGS